MVERDLGKDYATRLRTTDADVVVLDLVDEQYDLVVGSDGGVATRSMEFLRAGGDGVPSRRVASGSPEFLVRWEAGWAALVATARRQGRLGRVVVHEAYWARGDAAGGAFDQQRVEAANRTLTYLYARMRKDLPEARFLRVPDRLVVGDPSHRWGPSPVHYVEDYYRAFLDLLDEARRAAGGRGARQDAGPPRGRGPRGAGRSREGSGDAVEDDDAVLERHAAHPRARGACLEETLDVERDARVREHPHGPGGEALRRDDGLDPARRETEELVRGQAAGARVDGDRRDAVLHVDHAQRGADRGGEARREPERCGQALHLARVGDDVERVPASRHGRDERGELAAHEAEQVERLGEGQFLVHGAHHSGRAGRLGRLVVTGVSTRRPFLTQGNELG